MKKRTVSKYKVIKNASFDHKLYLTGQIIWIEDQDGTTTDNFRNIFTEQGSNICAIKNGDFPEFSQFIEKINS